MILIIIAWIIAIISPFFIIFLMITRRAPIERFLRRFDCCGCFHRNGYQQIREDGRPQAPQGPQFPPPIEEGDPIDENVGVELAQEALPDMQEYTEYVRQLCRAQVDDTNAVSEHLIRLMLRWDEAFGLYVFKERRKFESASARNKVYAVEYGVGNRHNLTQHHYLLFALRDAHGYNVGYLLCELFVDYFHRMIQRQAIHSAGERMAFSNILQRRVGGFRINPDFEQALRTYWNSPDNPCINNVRASLKGSENNNHLTDRSRIVFRIAEIIHEVPNDFRDQWKSLGPLRVPLPEILEAAFVDNKLYSPYDGALNNCHHYVERVLNRLRIDHTYLPPLPNEVVSFFRTSRMSSL